MSAKDRANDREVVQLSPQKTVDLRRDEVPSGTEQVASNTPDPEVSSTGKRRYLTAAYKARILRLADACTQLRERRRQVQRPAYSKPELMATEPNQLWSWDITKLHGPAKWNYYYLYVILDVFSRFVVGWLLAPCESRALAVSLIEETCVKQGIKPGQLTIHADRGSSMKSKRRGGRFSLIHGFAPFKARLLASALCLGLVQSSVFLSNILDTTSPELISNRSSS